MIAHILTALIMVVGIGSFITWPLGATVIIGIMAISVCTLILLGLGYVVLHEGIVEAIQMWHDYRSTKEE